MKNCRTHFEDMCTVN